MEVYFCRKSVGSIDISQVLTLGDLISKVIDLTKNKHPKINFPSGKEIIDTPPPHSNWSFLLLGRRERYISSFSLVQIDQKKNISLNSAVYRSIGDKTIPDISYKSAEKIFFFRHLPDWHKSMCFDKTQNAILKSHHQFLKTKDSAFRAENQKLRQNLANQIRLFLVPTSEDNEPISSDNSYTPPDKVPNVSISSGVSSGALPGLTVTVPSSNQVKPIEKIKKPTVNHSIIDTLNDPLEIMNPSSESEDLGPNKDDISLDQVVKEIKKSQEKEDYQMAQALHLQINNTPPPVINAGTLAIQRLIEKGIAVNALTGQ